MTEKPDELKKLLTIAGDLELSPDVRIKAVEAIGKIGSREAFLGLLELAAKEALFKKERELALKHATKIVKLER